MSFLLPLRAARVILLFCGVGAACAKSGETRFAADAGGPGNDLPKIILDGLLMDEKVAACGRHESEVRLDPGVLRVQRPDLDGDGRPDWVVASADRCLAGSSGAIWWVLRGIDDAAMTRTDGPPLILRAESATLKAVAERHGGFRDLIAEDGTVYRYDGEAYADASPTLAAQPAAPEASEAPRTLVDLRVPARLAAPAVDAATRRRVLDAAGAPGESTINSVIEGHFAAEVARQTVYVVQPGGPRAADPEARAAILLLTDGERTLGRFTASLGNFAIAVQDVDDDGLDDLLLRADNLQMGVQSTALQVLSLKDGAREIARFRQARVDGCDGPPLTQKVGAAVIRYRAGKGGDPVFEVEDYEAACQGGHAPVSDAAFQPAARQPH